MCAGRFFPLMVLCLAAAGPGLALDLAPPARVTATETEAPGSYLVPLGRWTAAGIPGQEVEGTVTRTAWSLPLDGQTTLQMLDTLRQKMRNEGFVTVFDCADDGCGGFDFRYGTPVLPEPAMHVDLGDYRFVSARRDGTGGTDWLTLLVSRSQAEGHVQVVTVTPLGTPTPARPAPVSLPEPGPEPAAVPDTAPVEAAPAEDGDLVARGAVVLEGLAFQSGKAALTDPAAPALQDLAGWLKAHPDRRVILVGHTDASGSLAANVTLSRQRAAAVRQVLIDRYGIPAAQVSAEGVGPLAPRASNETDTGRAQNRRVEAVLAPTQ